MKELTGCIYIRIQKGCVDKVFCHAGEFPQDGILHISLDDLKIDFRNKEQFRQTHPEDTKELEINTPVMLFNLGDKTLDQL